MKTVGIICEYNPFHLGHAEQIRRIRERMPDAAIVSLMSGSFVQRGEAAILAKYLRAETAVRAGADLVFELPYPWNCARAEIFASAGVSVLSGLGIGTLCFGSESGDTEKIVLTASRLESDQFRVLLEKAKAEAKHEGVSAVRLTQSVYEEAFGEWFPTEPNDILGVEYCRAIERLGSPMIPVTYPRISFYTASEARRAILSGEHGRLSALVPRETIRGLIGTSPIRPEALSPVVLALLRLSDAEERERVCGLPSGFAQRMKNALKEAGSLEELTSLLVSKLETRAQVRRLLLSCALGTEKERTAVMPAYALLLGASARGREVLHGMKKTSLLPILTKPADYVGLPVPACDQFLCNLRAEEMIASAVGIPSAELIRKSPYMGE